ncbi:MAG: hydrolase [Actinobacteria bacterium HGW-Actinobacteria-2]|nr:MAG: hydrolase [Actinobacteria bacterium HGW-Actinobacteria-2]
MIRLILLAVQVAALVVGPVPASPSVVAPSSALPIEGYLMDADGAIGHLEANIAAISIVGVDGVTLTRSGGGLTATPDIAVEAIALAHRNGKKAELLLSNYSESLGDFSPAIAKRLLTSTRHRAAVVKALVARVKKYGFDGVQVDLESLKPSYAAGLTAFVKQLRKALPRSKRISMAVMASSTVKGYKNAGYQLTKLRRVVSRFVLMAYDQHGPGWSSAGPVGGTPWVQQVLAGFIRAKVRRSQIDLGVAQYGYSWPADGTPGTSLSVAQARALAGDRAVFDTTQQEWTATLADGTLLWWSDRDTLTARRQLAADQGLHGLAVWELSLADPLP